MASSAHFARERNKKRFRNKLESKLDRSVTHAFTSATYKGERERKKLRMAGHLLRSTFFSYSALRTHARTHHFRYTRATVKANARKGSNARAHTPSRIHFPIDTFLFQWQQQLHAA